MCRFSASCSPLSRHFAHIRRFSPRRFFCAFLVFVSVMLCMFVIFFYSCIIYPYSLVCAFFGFFMLRVKTVIRVLVVQGSFQGPLFSHSLFPTHIVVAWFRLLTFFFSCLCIYLLYITFFMFLYELYYFSIFLLL